MKLSLVVLLGSLALGCGKGTDKPEAHSNKAAEKAVWEQLNLEDGSFTASFPGAAITQFRQNNIGKQVLCGLNQPDGVTYTIIMTQVNETGPGPDPRQRLKALVARAPLSYGANARLESTRQDLKVEGNAAAEYSLSFTNHGKALKLRCRLFFAHNGHQLFQLIAAGPQGAPDAQKFFEGIKLGKYTPGKKVAEPGSGSSPSPKAAGHGH